MFSQCRTCFSIKHIFISARKSTHEKLRYKFCTILTRYHKKEEKKKNKTIKTKSKITLCIFFFSIAENFITEWVRKKVWWRKKITFFPLFFEFLSFIFSSFTHFYPIFFFFFLRILPYSPTFCGEHHWVNIIRVRLYWQRFPSVLSCTTL